MDSSLNHKSICYMERKKERKKKGENEEYDLYCYDIFAIFSRFPRLIRKPVEKNIFPIHKYYPDSVMCTHMDNRRKRKK